MQRPTLLHGFTAQPEARSATRCDTFAGFLGSLILVEFEYFEIPTSKISQELDQFRGMCWISAVWSIWRWSVGGIVHILRQPSSDRVHARPTDSRASMDSRKASERGSERGHGSHWKENRKTSMFFHHFLSCFLMFGGSSVSSKWQMQQRYFDTISSILILLPASAVTCMPEIWGVSQNGLSNPTPSNEYLEARHQRRDKRRAFGGCLLGEYLSFPERLGIVRWKCLNIFVANWYATWFGAMMYDDVFSVAITYCLNKCSGNCSMFFFKYFYHNCRQHVFRDLDKRFE